MWAHHIGDLEWVQANECTRRRTKMKERARARKGKLVNCALRGRGGEGGGGREDAVRTKLACSDKTLKLLDETWRMQRLYPKGICLPHSVVKHKFVPLDSKLKQVANVNVFKPVVGGFPFGRHVWDQALLNEQSTCVCQHQTIVHASSQTASSGITPFEANPNERINRIEIGQIV